MHVLFIKGILNFLDYNRMMNYSFHIYSNLDLDQTYLNYFYHIHDEIVFPVISY